MNFQIVFVLILHCFLAVTGYWAECGSEPWLNTECMKLTECEGLVTYIKRLYTSNRVVHQYFLGQPLLNMTCGFDGNVPKVCCQQENRFGKHIKNQVNNQLPSRRSFTNCGNILWTKSLTANGEPTDLAEFPWLALLEYDLPTGVKFGCGGVLISERYVLTAAHCLTSSLARVRLGEYDVSTTMDCVWENKGDPGYLRHCNNELTVVGIDKYIVHPGYDYRPVPFDARSHDIALLRLKYPVQFSDYIKPVCLPSDESAPNEAKFLAAGWGANLQNKYLRSNVKRNSRLIKVEKNQCEAVYKKSLDEDLFCAQAKSNKSLCIEDSGGPLMTFDRQSRMVVTGILTPASTKYCQYFGVPGVYVDVRKHTNWIIANMK